MIHSFWVPALSGKTDVIPGQNNLTWLQADKPGIYRGQCAEYCGKQHANMAFFVVAEPEQEFEDWRQHQIAPAAPPSDTAQAVAAFQTRCGVCHTVRGTPAYAPVTLAVGTAIIFVGMLYRSWPGIGIGVILTGVALLLWLWPGRLREGSPEAADEPPFAEPGHV